MLWIWGFDWVLQKDLTKAGQSKWVSLPRGHVTTSTVIRFLQRRLDLRLAARVWSKELK